MSEDGDACTCGHLREHHDQGAGHCVVQRHTPEGGLLWIDSCGHFRTPIPERKPR